MNSPKFKPGDLVTYKLADGTTSSAISIYSVYYNLDNVVEYYLRGFGTFDESELTAYETPTLAKF